MIPSMLSAPDSHKSGEAFFCFQRPQVLSLALLMWKACACHWRHCHTVHQRRGMFQLPLEFRSTSSGCQGRPRKQKIHLVYINVLSTSQRAHRADGNLAGLMVSDTIVLLTHSCCAPVLLWGHSRHQWDPVAAREGTTGSSSSPLQLLRLCVSTLQRE